MNHHKYDENSVDSIIDFASKIIGKSLAEVVLLPPEIMNKKNKGDLGSLIEKYYFEHIPPNNHEPDFKNAVKVFQDDYGKRSYVGLELKTTGVLKDKKSGYKAKERLVLTMINYESIINENWLSSTFRNKCKLMLILFYFYQKEVDVIDRKFVLKPTLYELEIPAEDLAQIQKDWETIKKSVVQAKAHELSEGDTFYLGACRKGSGGPNEKLVKQPNSDIKARSRAFSFKPSYVNRIIEINNINEAENIQEAILGVNQDTTFIEATEIKFRNYLGLPTAEISKKLNYPYKGKNHKGYWRNLSNIILSGSNNRIKELDKAGIEMKTIRLKKSGIPREPMSFPAFDFEEIINEEWVDSSFCDKIESKFLFVIFKEDIDGVERLYKVAYWNMPYEDREEARIVWELTKDLTSKSRPDLFPKSSDNPVAHVRPKGKDGSDKSKLPNGSLFLKQCFWLNKKYIQSVVEKL